MPFNLAAYVLRHAERRADHIALAVLDGPCWSYRALDAAVRGTATGLLGRGLVPGDRVLMRMGNCPEFPIAFLGAITAGLVPIPTAQGLTVPEVDKIVAETEPRLVIHDRATSMPSQGLDGLSLTDLGGMARLPPAAFQLGDPERPAYIIYTSGTAGQPRAVVHAHRAILARQMMVDGWTGLTPDDRLLHAGAFNWTYTLGTGLLDPWTMGATALIPPPGTAADALPELLAQHRATIFAAAPGVYRKLLRADIPALPHLRHGLSAGEKLPDRTRAAWETATGTAIHEAFGMSECSTFVSGAPARPAPPGTLGFPQPGRQVRVMPDGQIAVHRDDPGLMLGYLNQPKETAARFNGDWFLTGDIGTIDADGAIRYDGRRDDMMNAGGLRVSPLEVEAVLGTCPGVVEAAAAEVRLSSDTSVIAAFYVAQDMLDEAALAAHCARHLADYKRPRIYERLAQLPRGPNNTLQRRLLRQEYEARHGQT